VLVAVSAQPLSVGHPVRVAFRGDIVGVGQVRDFEFVADNPGPEDVTRDARTTRRTLRRNDAMKVR